MCANNSSLLAIPLSAGETGLWELVGGGGIIVNPTLNNTPVTNLSPGENTFRWTVTSGLCTSSDEMNIFYHYVYANAGTDQEICNNYTTLSANDPSLQGATGEWSIAGFGSAEIFANKTLYNTNVTNIAAGINTFRWTVTKPDGCIASDYVYITDNTPFVNAGPDETTNIDSYQLQALVYPLDADGAWSITAGSGVFEDYTDPNTVVNELNYGFNTLRWSATFNTCSDFDEVVILRTVNAGNDITLDGDTVYLYGILPEGTTGQWTIMYGTAVIENPNMPHTKAWDLSPGINVFRWTVTFPDKGMVLWDEVEVNRATGVENLESNIVIYPNPTKGLLNIDYGNVMTNANIRIFDITGSEVKYKFVKKSLNKASIKLQKNKQGLYFIEIKTNKAVFIKKVIIH